VGLARLAAAGGRAMIVALLGAESTGKSTLALALQQVLAAQGRRVARVDEVLREFCDAHGRTPQRHEQAGIAAEQTRRIHAAAQANEIVIADTTALQIAVYSDLVFGDRSLYAGALQPHAHCRHRRLGEVDLPWVADGRQPDAPQVREPVDTLLRTALQRHARGYAVVGGQDAQRTAAALTVLQPPPAQAPAPRWQWLCERCGDADCERHLLPR